MSWIESVNIPLKDRSSYIYVEHCIIDVRNSAFVMQDLEGNTFGAPLGILACLMLGPGTSVTHAAVKLAADVHCLLLWVGENGVRIYSAGMPGGNRCDRLLIQSKYALDDKLRASIVRRMYQYRFEEIFEENLSIEQMRGKEAYRVKSIYRKLSDRFGVQWNGRSYDAKDWKSADDINRAISSATSCLYGLCEAAILIAGYSPSIGFIHYGRPRSFVFDIADLMKYETVVPLAFQTVSEKPDNLESEIRHRCRELFKKERILERLVPLINSFFDENTVTLIGVVEPPPFSQYEGEFYSGLGNRECP